MVQGHATLPTCSILTDTAVRSRRLPSLPNLRISHKSWYTTMGSLDDVETAKRNAAIAAVRDHFPAKPRFVGIGSGTTIVYVVEAIKNLNVDLSNTLFIPTGYHSRDLIINAGLIPISYESLRKGDRLDIAFDGADEVDDDLNCIKGGGACLFQEKAVAMRAKEFICVAGRQNALRGTAAFRC